MEDAKLSEKLSDIQEQLDKLKILIAMRMLKKKKKLISLRGILYSRF